MFCAQFNSHLEVNQTVVVDIQLTLSLCVDICRDVHTYKFISEAEASGELRGVIIFILDE